MTEIGRMALERTIDEDRDRCPECKRIYIPDRTISELIRAGFRRSPNKDRVYWYKREGGKVMIYGKRKDNLCKRLYYGEFKYVEDILKLRIKDE